VQAPMTVASALGLVPRHRARARAGARLAAAPSPLGRIAEVTVSVFPTSALRRLVAMPKEHRLALGLLPRRRSRKAGARLVAAPEAALMRARG